MPTNVTISDITAVLENWAPLGRQAGFDNSGLQVGDPSETVTGIVVALDLVPAVIEEAKRTGANLIITHHPNIFKPLSSVITDDWNGALVWRLAQAGIAHYAIHTNLDATTGGVSFALAEQFGLENLSILAPEKDALCKLVTFAPDSHADAVREALADAGAGHIGEYEGCSFSTQGTGRFRASEKADPHVGSAGSETSVDEARIEVEVERARLSTILRRLTAAHPYEEVAYDIYPLEQPSTRIGYGATGTLPQSLRLPDFLDLVCERLDTEAVRYVGDADQSVERVAVCGGAGMTFMQAALRSGADAYVTADITYHRFFEALAPDGTLAMALVDAGHYETERITESLVAEHLEKHFPDLDIRQTGVRTSPIQTHVEG